MGPKALRDVTSDHLPLLSLPGSLWPPCCFAHMGTLPGQGRCPVVPVMLVPLDLPICLPSIGVLLKGHSQETFSDPQALDSPYSLRSS